MLSNYRAGQLLRARGVPRNEWSQILAFARTHRVSIATAINRLTNTARSVGLKSRWERNIVVGTDPRPTDRPEVVTNKKRRLEYPESAAMPVQAQRIDYKRQQRRKRISRLGRFMQQMKSHLLPQVERWSLCRAVPANDSVEIPIGATILNAGPVDASKNNWPVVLFDLTGVYNHSAVAGASVGSFDRFPGVSYRLSNDLTSGNFFYSQNYGANITDTSVNMVSWIDEKNPRSQLTRAGDSAVIDAIKIEMATFGAVQLASEMYIELWRFTDEELVPQVYQSTLATLSGTVTEPLGYPTANRMNEFWRYHLGKLVGRMDHRGVSPDLGKGVEKTRLAHFVYDPQTADATAQIGHQRNLSFYKDMNRYVKLDWNVTNDTTLPVGDVDNPDVFVSEAVGTCVETVPKPCSRIFLVVSGDIQQMHSTTGGANNANLFPSFDIVLRRYRRVIKD